MDADAVDAGHDVEAVDAHTGVADASTPPDVTSTAGQDAAVDAEADNDAGPADASVAETSTTFDAGNAHDAGTESGSDAVSPTAVTPSGPARAATGRRTSAPRR